MEVGAEKSNESNGKMKISEGERRVQQWRWRNWENPLSKNEKKKRKGREKKKVYSYFIKERINRQWSVGKLKYDQYLMDKIFHRYIQNMYMSINLSIIIIYQNTMIREYIFVDNIRFLCSVTYKHWKLGYYLRHYKKKKQEQSIQNIKMKMLKVVYLILKI